MPSADFFRPSKFRRNDFSFSFSFRWVFPSEYLIQAGFSGRRGLFIFETAKVSSQKFRFLISSAFPFRLVFGFPQFNLSIFHLKTQKIFRIPRVFFGFLMVAEFFSNGWQLRYNHNSQTEPHGKVNKYKGKANRVQ